MLKFVARSMAALLLVATGTATFAAQEHKPEAKQEKHDKKPETMQKDIVDTAVAAGEFKTLAKLLDAAGLVSTLKDKGPFTVFAPTDAAFEKLGKETLDSLTKPENKAKLQSILKYHVVASKTMAADVAKLKTVKTVNGQEATITTKDGKVMIDNATITKTDIAASNGVIHVIDTVIMPKAQP